MTTHSIEILFESPIGDLNLEISFELSSSDCEVGLMFDHIEGWWVESINGEKANEITRNTISDLLQGFETRILENCRESLKG